MRMGLGTAAKARAAGMMRRLAVCRLAKLASSQASGVWRHRLWCEIFVTLTWSSFQTKWSVHSALL